MHTVYAIREIFTALSVQLGKIESERSELLESDYEMLRALHLSHAKGSLWDPLTSAAVA